MSGKMIEFPSVTVERPGFRSRPKTTEQIVAELAPTIQTEADLQHLLSQVDGTEAQKASIEKCLRDNGACVTPENPAC